MAATCPACDKPVDPLHKPFCSRGCKDRDLLRWLGEGYRIAGPPDEDARESGVDRPGEPDL